jgi:tripartite motif-containing protein 71
VRVKSRRLAAFTTFDATARRYEIEPFGGRVCARGPLGVKLQEFGRGGREPDQLNHAVALAVGPDNQVYVLDRGHSRIKVFDQRGHYLRQFGTSGSEATDLRSPRSLAFDRAGRLWVADTLNHRLQVFDRSGASLARVGELGTKLGQFNGPIALAFAPNGHLHALDHGNRRVQVFSAEGELLGSYGEGTLQSGRSLAIARDGRSYVADTLQATLEVFTSAGSHELQRRLRFEDGGEAVPVQLAFSPAGAMYVAAQRGARQARRSA